MSQSATTWKTGCIENNRAQRSWAGVDELWIAYSMFFSRSIPNKKPASSAHVPHAEVHVLRAAFISLGLRQDFYDTLFVIHDNGMLLSSPVRWKHTHFHICVQLRVVSSRP